MPYNLRPRCNPSDHQQDASNLPQRYNLRSRQQQQRPTKQKKQPTKQQKTQRKKQKGKPLTPQQRWENDEMHPRLKAMGFEKVCFIPDPERGLKEGEKPPTPFTEEIDLEALYGPPLRHTGYRLDQSIRDAGKKSAFMAGYVRAWDSMFIDD